MEKLGIQYNCTIFWYGLELWRVRNTYLQFFVREILVEESNVQRVDSPVTVSIVKTKP